MIYFNDYVYLPETFTKESNEEVLHFLESPSYHYRRTLFLEKWDQGELILNTTALAIIEFEQDDLEELRRLVQ